MSSLRFVLLSVLLSNIFCGTLCLITETRPVSDFGSIDVLSGPFIVTVEVTGTEGLTIEADVDSTNVTDSILTKVDDHSLIIKFLPPYDKEWSQFEGRIRIKITAKNRLASFVNAGSGSMDVLSKIISSSVSLINRGSGNMTINVKSDNFNAVSYGPGGITVGGTANMGSMSLTGAGPIDASKLESRTTTVAIYGSGDITVNAKLMLNAMTMGSGTVYYRGPAMVSQTKMGFGSVIKLD